jgi:hypothetical protein
MLPFDLVEELGCVVIPAGMQVIEALVVEFLDRTFDIIVLLIGGAGCEREKEDTCYGMPQQVGGGKRQRFHGQVRLNWDGDDRRERWTIERYSLDLNRVGARRCAPAVPGRLSRCLG